MPNSHPRQNESITNLLETSRAYLGLPERRRMTRSPYRHLRRIILRLALLTGSLGTLFGNVALAEYQLNASRPQDETWSISQVEQQERRSIEAMP